MCKLSEDPIEEKVVAGYKRVLIVKGRYFSSATGLEYKEGMNLPCLTPDDVPFREIHTGSNFLPARTIVRRGNPCFSERMQGRTAVYCNIHDVPLWRGETVVKMTISEDLLEGTYGWEDAPVVAGKHIDKIEPLSTKELYILGITGFEEPELLVDLG